MKSVSHHVKKKKFKTVQDIVNIQDVVVAEPRSILVFSGGYHIMSNASLVNNCFII